MWKKYMQLTKLQKKRLGKMKNMRIMMKIML